jgi:hypothetical protein
MMSSVETPVDGSTLIVRIPHAIPAHGGRKRIVAPPFASPCRARFWLQPG